MSVSQHVSLTIAPAKHVDWCYTSDVASFFTNVHQQYLMTHFAIMLWACITGQTAQLLTGAPSAWPTSFSVAASSDTSSDSMSVSDDEEARTAFSPSSLVSSFVDQARGLTASLDSPRQGSVLEKERAQLGDVTSHMASAFMSKAMQFTGQGFGASQFSSAGAQKAASRQASAVGQYSYPHRLHEIVMHSELCTKHCWTVCTCQLSFAACANSFIMPLFAMYKAASPVSECS